jgi:hypothetical protein
MKITNIIFLSFLTFLSTFAFAKEVTLRWKSIPDTNSYELEVAKDKTFTNLVFVRETKLAALNTNLDPGIYFLRVRGVATSGARGTWSSPFRLSVTAPQESVASEIAIQNVPLDLFEKRWYVSFGPAFSSTLNLNGGSLFSARLGILKPISEHVDFMVFYDSSFVTSAQSTSSFSFLGLNVDYLAKDRASYTSPFASLDIGYGGSNRALEAQTILGAGFGVQFFRKNSKAFFEVRDQFQMMYSNALLWNELHLALHV